MSRTKAGSAKASYRTAGDTEERKDVYTRVTERIIADLEQGVRSWLKPWHAEHAAGKITRPLRHNGTPYNGINILLLWGEALAKGYAAPIWMTYKQAQELGANVRKGEKGSLVVYANRVSKPQIMAALQEARNQPPAPAWDKLKKADLAALAERELADKAWLPEPLR